MLAFLSLPDPQGLSNPVKDIERFLQVLLAVGSGDHHPDAGLPHGDSGETQRHGEQTFIKQAPAELARQLHIPQQAAFFRAELWREVGPLDDSFFFAMDYDLWVRLAQKAPLSHTPKAWAAFRLHDDAKSISADDRCWPEMLKVHYRDGGSRFAPIVAKYWVRKLVQPAWIWYQKQQIALQSPHKYQSTPKASSHWLDKYFVLI